MSLKGPRFTFVSFLIIHNMSLCPEISPETDPILSAPMQRPRGAPALLVSILFQHTDHTTDLQNLSIFTQKGFLYMLKWSSNSCKIIHFLTEGSCVSNFQPKVCDHTDCAYKYECNYTGCYKHKSMSFCTARYKITNQGGTEKRWHGNAVLQETTKKKTLSGEKVLNLNPIEVAVPTVYCIYELLNSKGIFTFFTVLISSQTL